MSTIGKTKKNYPDMWSKWITSVKNKKKNKPTVNSKGAKFTPGGIFIGLIN